VSIELPLRVLPDFAAADGSVCAGVDAVLIDPEAVGCICLCGRVDKFGVETALELHELGWMPFSLDGNCLPRPLEYSCEESRATECPLPPPPRPPRVGLLPPLPGLVLKSADSLFAPPYITTSNGWKESASLQSAGECL
jgi:hypothetical protein